MSLSNSEAEGTMLPCNVIVQKLDYGTIEVSAVDPLASMQAIQNGELQSDVVGT